MPLARAEAVEEARNKEEQVRGQKRDGEVPPSWKTRLEMPGKKTYP